MSKFSRGLALLLCIAMLVGMFPAAVFAEEVKQPQSINFMDPAEASKFSIESQDVTKIREGQGLYLVSTTDAFEPCNGQISTSSTKDVVKVPAEGDWTATIKVKFDQAGSPGYYEFFGFYAMDDYNNLVGIRGGDGAIQDFIRQSGTVKADTDGVKTTSGLKSASTHWFRIAKTGDDYVCYWSTDGLKFTQTFSYQDTGITGNTICMDAYSGMSTGYNYTVEYLYFGDDTDAMNQFAVENAADALVKKIPTDIPLQVDDIYRLPSAICGYPVTYTADPDCVTADGKMTALKDETVVSLTGTVSGMGKTAARTVSVTLPAAGTGTAPAETYVVTFNPNYAGMESVSVTVPAGEKVQIPEGLTRDGYIATWRNGNSAFDFNTPIMQNYTLTARWTKNWSAVPSLAGEYADYFPVGCFGGSIGNEQTNYHYATLSGNYGKLTYNIGGGDKASGAGTASRIAYDNAVAAINADTTLTAEEKAAKIEEANRNVELITSTPTLFNTLNAIRAWNQEHPDQKKYYRQHVLAWHGSEQPDYFFCNGYNYDPSNPDWASPETMLARLDNYIQKMMERYVQYDDVILSWDVVNEAIDDYTGQIRNSEGYQVGEWGTVFRRPDLDNDPDARLEAESAWVRQAFASARKWTNYYGGHWKLYYNDFQDSDKLYEPKMSQTIKMLKPIYEAGNIDGYGMQARLAYAYPSIDLLRQQIELGLTVADEVSFSEADIRSDFITNPNYDPNQPTRRVVSGDPVWPENSGYYSRISSDNGNTFDVHNSPVYRNPAWGVGSLSNLATDPEIMKAQADYAADLMDLVLEYKDQFGAVAWDGYNDNSTFNRTTGCQMWDRNSNEKYSFFAIIGAPNRYKMGEAIENGPSAEDAAKYTASSWATYQDALAAAKALVDVRIYDLDGVNAVKEATANLNAAIEGLVSVDQIPIYEDTSYSFAERAADLVARMSVAQKGSQMISSPAPAIAAEDLGGGAMNTTATKDLPSYYWWNEGLHGYNRIDNGASAKNNVGPANSVSYPQSLTVGSTWNPELYYQEALQVSDEIRERTDINTQTGNAKDLNFYSPTVNLQRDPRWGRNEESYSEDVYLTTAMGSQYVLGLEGKDQDGNLLDPNGYYRVHSTIKHYVANTSEQNRLNGGAVTDLEALRNYYVQPYRNIIQATDVTSVMTAYSTLNGEPCSYSSYLMDTLLRQTFGLSGYITSDCDSVGTMTRHNYVNPHTGEVLTGVEQMAGALAHGEDLECNGGYSSSVGNYSSLANRMVSENIVTDKGLFTENTMDVALHRLMTGRIATGEFDDNLALTAAAKERIAAQKEAVAGLSETAQAVYNQTAERLALVDAVNNEGVVMLQNKNNTLPLSIPASGEYKVVIVGAWQTNMYLGLYSATENNTTNLINIQKGITDAIKAVNPDATFTYITSNTLSAEDEAVIAAADVAIAVAGTDKNYSAEDRDRASIALSNGQDTMIANVGKLNDTTIAVMETCGPMQVTKFENEVGAILWSSYGGLHKGVGFGNIITGAVNPSGHLTATWHQNVSNSGESDIPSVLNYNMYNTNGDSGRTYMYYNGETPVSYPFGYGLSFTTFEYSNLKIDKTSYDANDTVKVTFDVTNTGKVAGKEVTQLYIAQPEAPAELNRPIRRLEGFEKIELQPGETKTVSMEVAIPDLAFYSEANDCFSVDTGAYQVQVGEDSSSANLTADFTVTGKMDVYPQVLTVKANQEGDTEAGIEQRLIYDMGKTINPQLTVAMNDESLYGYIIADQMSPIKSLKSTALPEGMTFTYESNRPEVVSVEGDTITCVAPGVATITVTGELDGHVVTTDFVAYVQATAFIDGIQVDGVDIGNFNSKSFEYEIAVGKDAKVPTVTGYSANKAINITVEAPETLPGVVVINAVNTNSGSTATYRVGMGYAPVSTDFSEGWEAVQAKGWTVTNGNDSAVFDENGLSIPLAQGAIGGAVPASNLYTMPAFGNWVASTNITLSSDLSTSGSATGLLVYEDDGNYLQFVYEAARSWWSTRRYVRAYAVVNGSKNQIASASVSGTTKNLSLQIVKNNGKYELQYAINGGAQKTLCTTSMAFATPKLAPFAATNASISEPPVATFDGISIADYDQLYPRLTSVSIDGVKMASFDPEVFNYNTLLDDNASTVPTFSATAAEGLTVTIEQMTAPAGVATITVASEAGKTKYTFSYNYAPKDDYFADGDFSDNWTILNEKKDGYRVEVGTGLVMPTQSNNIYQSGSGWNNCFVMPAQGNWEVVAKAFYPQIPNANYQQAMLLGWQDEDNYIRINCQESRMFVEPGREVDGTFSTSGFQTGTVAANEDGTATLYFKMRKDGTTYTVAYSTDGIHWVNAGSAKNVDYANPMIGLLVTEDSTAEPIDLAFEYVAVTWLNGVDQRTDAEVLTWAAQNAADYIAAALPTTASENIQLAAAPHGYTVELISSNPAVIAADGTVTPGATDQTVQVSIKVTEGETTATSEAVSITVPGSNKFGIVTQPESYVGAVGSTATFHVEANGEGLSYQWYYSNNGGKSFAKSMLRGSTTDTLPVALSAYRDGQQYKCVVTDVNGETVETVVVTMSVVVPAEELAITGNPENFTGAVGETATFAVEATGEGLSYQWYYSNNGGKSFAKSTLPGATTESLDVQYKAFRAGQQYKCVVTDVSGNTVESAVATLGAK